MTKAKVFLLGTSVEEQNKTQGKSIETPTTHYSLGLLYLDAILQEHGYEVLTKEYLIWEEKNCLKKVEEIMRKYKPDFVGIAILSMTRVSAYKAIKIIKQINPNTKIILGGMHASLMAKQLLQNFEIEAVCIGDAEDSLLEIIEALRKNKSLKNIPGIVYKNKDKIIFTKERTLRRDLDELPFPNYDAFMNPAIDEINMISSRGCPNDCTFCSIQVTCRRSWRPRNYMKVVDQIEWIIKKYPWLKKINFVDDTITINNQRVIEMCKEIIKRGIQIEFNCESRIKPVSREMFYWMEKAGFRQICFGIESGSPTILKSSHKNITPEECLHTFSLLKEFKKIEVVKYLMVGLPGETEETIKETIELIKKLQKIIPMNFFYATPLWIYPGTEVYNMTKSKGFINDDYWLTDKACPLFTLEHSEEWLKKMSNKVALETMLAQGRLYFIKRALNKLLTNPRYYINRILNTGKVK